MRSLQIASIYTYILHLGERTYTMMNDEKVIVRRRGRCMNFETLVGSKNFISLISWLL